MCKDWLRHWFPCNEAKGLLKDFNLVLQFIIQSFPKGREQKALLQKIFWLYLTDKIDFTFVIQSKVNKYLGKIRI